MVLLYCIHDLKIDAYVYDLLREAFPPDRDYLIYNSIIGY